MSRSLCGVGVLWLLLLPVIAGAEDLRVAASATAWRATHDSLVEATAEGLRVTITGADPYITGPRFTPPVSGPVIVKLRIRSEAGGAGQLFYDTDGPREAQSIRFGIAGGSWQEVWLPLPALPSPVRFRLDPPGQSGACWIESWEVLPSLSADWPQWEPIAPLDPVLTDTIGTDSLQFRHAQDRLASELWIDGQRFATSGVVPQIGIEVDAHTVWLPLKAQSVETRPRELTAVAQAALPGGGQLTLTQRVTTTPHKTLAIEARLATTQPLRIVYAPLWLAFPGHREFGTQKGQALLPGVEYLEDEPSSSDADVDAARALRRVPAAYKVTFPLMVLQHEDRWLGVIWKPQPEVAALFDTPDRIFGSQAHVLGLIAPGVADGRREDGHELPRVASPLSPESPLILKAELIGGRGRSIVPAVQQFHSLQGLPPLPAKPTSTEMAQLLAAGWLGEPLQDGPRFRHAVAGDMFRAQPAADAIWMMQQLSAVLKRSDPSVATIAELDTASDAALAAIDPNLIHRAAVGHIRTPASSLLLGDTQSGLQQARRGAEGQLGRLDAEGRVSYVRKPDRPDFARTHWSPEANGFVALVVAQALEDAAFSGDSQLIERSLTALRQLDRYRDTVPRGAQTWEIPLHTPDILASGHLVSAYMLGYELTREPQFLKAAQYWAWTGVPFIYLQPQFPGPIGNYATIPVLGATHWDSVLWIGLPVQWCGLVYADALDRLARYDDQGPWRQLADGIALSGLQQTYPLDHPHAGLLPDSFQVLAQQRNPADINPGTLQIPAMRTWLGWESYDVRHVIENRWTVHAPGRILIHEALPTRAVIDIQGWSSKPYSVVIHGVRPRPTIEARDAKGVLLKLEEETYLPETGTVIVRPSGHCRLTIDNAGK